MQTNAFSTAFATLSRLFGPVFALSQRFNREVDRRLHRRGVTAAPVRRALCIQAQIAAAALLATIPFLWIGLWPLAFAAGVALSTFNFYYLALSIQQAVFQPFDRSLLVTMLVKFYGRLALTAVVLFVLIVWCQAPVLALILGLSTMVVTILFWGGARLIEQNAKEA